MSLRFVVPAALALVVAACGGRRTTRIDGPAPGAAVAGSAQCRPQPAVLGCGRDDQCEPFTCDRSRRQCRMLCESREDCSPPYVCAAGACVYPGTCGACTEASDCAPFSCNVSTSSCYTACIRLEDCAPGFACEGHQCVQAMPTPLAR